MITYAVVLPYFDPVAFFLGPLAVKWYALAYVFGILYGYLFLSKYSNFTREELDSLFCYITLGITLGGRLGYVTFYNAPYYIANPLEILMLWKGGMAFHGGLVGVLLGTICFSYRHSCNFFQLSDLVATSASLGILLGRIGNFINAELYGRATSYPWGVIFPNSDGIARHPVQLYEGFFEGFLLFIVMQVLFFKTRIRQNPGTLMGLWLTSYGLMRIIIENFREPDSQIGYFIHFVTMGQILSAPMIGLGVALMIVAMKNPRT